MIATVVCVINWNLVAIVILAHGTVELVTKSMSNFDVGSKRFLHDHDFQGLIFCTQAGPQDIVTSEMILFLKEHK